MNRNIIRQLESLYQYYLSNPTAGRISHFPIEQRLKTVKFLQHQLVDLDTNNLNPIPLYLASYYTYKYNQFFSINNSIVKPFYINEQTNLITTQLQFLKLFVNRNAEVLQKAQIKDITFYVGEGMILDTDFNPLFMLGIQFVSSNLKDLYKVSREESNIIKFDPCFGCAPVLFVDRKVLVNVNNFLYKYINQHLLSFYVNLKFDFHNISGNPRLAPRYPTLIVDSFSKYLSITAPIKSNINDVEALSEDIYQFLNNTIIF
jgi:hypothetical protein